MWNPFLCVFMCAGESRANPVCLEFHWGWSSPADSSGWLPQPTHGESLYVLFEKRKVPARVTSQLLSSLLLVGLRPSIDWAVLWRGGGSHLPGSLLLCHRSDVLIYCVQCATYLAWQEVKHTHICNFSHAPVALFQDAVWVDSTPPFLFFCLQFFRYIGIFRSFFKVGWTFSRVFFLKLRSPASRYHTAHFLVLSGQDSCGNLCAEFTDLWL